MQSSGDSYTGAPGPGRCHPRWAQKRRDRLKQLGGEGNVAVAAGSDAPSHTSERASIDYAPIQDSVLVRYLTGSPPGKKNAAVDQHYLFDLLNLPNKVVAPNASSKTSREP